MIFKKFIKNFLFNIIIALGTFVLSLPCCAFQAVVPLNITVHGKMLVSNEYDIPKGLNKTVNLAVNPSINKYSGSVAVRMRTNLSQWKLEAVRSLEANDISPERMFLKFKTKFGSKTNPNSARIASNFRGITPLSNISNTAPVTILEGRGMTSMKRDPSGSQNWLELRTDYYYDANNELFDREQSTTINFNLASI